MARSRIVTGLEKLMSDLPKLMIQRSLAQDSIMKQLSMQQIEGRLKDASKYTSEAQFDEAVERMKGESAQWHGDPTMDMAGANAIESLGRLRDNFVGKQDATADLTSLFSEMSQVKALDSTEQSQELYNKINTTLNAKRQFYNTQEYSAYQKSLDSFSEGIKIQGMINILDNKMTGVDQPGVQSITEQGMVLQTANELVKIGYNKQALNLYADASKNFSHVTSGMIASGVAPVVRQSIRSIQGFDMSSVDESFTKHLTHDYNKIPSNTDFTPATIGVINTGAKKDLMALLDSDKDWQFGASIFNALPSKYSEDIDGLAKYMRDNNVEPKDMYGEILKVLDVPGTGAENKAGAQLFGHIMNVYMTTSDAMHQININSAMSSTPNGAIGSYVNNLIATNGGTQPVSGTGTQTTGAPVMATKSGTGGATVPQGLNMSQGNWTTAAAEEEKRLARKAEFANIPESEWDRVTPDKAEDPFVPSKHTFQVQKGSSVLDLVKAISNSNQDNARKQEFANIPESEWNRVTNAPSAPSSHSTKNLNSNILDLVKSVKKGNREMIYDPSTGKRVPMSGYQKNKPGYGGAISKGMSKLSGKPKASGTDVRVAVRSQNLEESDVDYISSLDPGKIKKLGTWMDNNKKMKLFSAAKKDLKDFTQQLGIEVINAKKQGASKKEVAQAEAEFKEYSKLLKSFNKDSKLTKDKLEYIYSLFGYEYDGVDDFLASLSDGKIGIE